MTIKALQTAANLTNEMTVDELRALNKIVCDLIKSQHKQKLAVAGAAFGVGDLVSFMDRNGVTRFVKVTGFKRDRTAIKGIETGPTGASTSAIRPMNWTVANTLLTLVKKAA